MKLLSFIEKRKDLLRKEVSSENTAESDKKIKEKNVMKSV